MARKSERKASSEPAWRPNFVLKDELPDTKVVRTNFLLNFLSVFVAICAVGVVAYNKYSLATTQTLMESVESEVLRGRDENQKTIELFREYAKLTKPLGEVVSFGYTPIGFSELVHTLAIKKPEGMLLDQIRVSFTTEGEGRRGKPAILLELAGTLDAGEGQLPSEVISAYQKSVAEHPDIKEVVTRNELTGFQRDDRLKLFTFRVEIALNAEEKG